MSFSLGHRCRVPLQATIILALSEPRSTTSDIEIFRCLYPPFALAFIAANPKSNSPQCVLQDELRVRSLNFSSNHSHHLTSQCPTPNNKPSISPPSSSSSSSSVSQSAISSFHPPRAILGPQIAAEELIPCTWTKYNRCSRS